MKLNCLIVDDEPIARRILERFLEKADDVRIVGSCQNAMKASSVLSKEKVDIMFLDIQMPGLNGLQFIKTLKSRPYVILTTAYRDFAIEAFDLDVEDYLLKPFSFERFYKALNRVRHRISTNRNQSSEKDTDVIFFKSDRKNVKVKFKDILYIEGMSNYVRIHRRDGSLTVYHRMMDLENELPRDRFVRIHRSYIVSLHHLDAFNSDIVEIAGREFSVGNRYKKSFLEAVDNMR